jgi:hypothetical protein
VHERRTPLPELIAVSATIRYRAAFTVTVRRKTLRRGAAAAAGELHAALCEQAADLPARIEALRADAARRRAEAQAHLAAAAASSFTEQRELDRAVAKLARVTSEIESPAANGAA